jgi:hypothetical protein
METLNIITWRWKLLKFYFSQHTMLNKVLV